MRHVIHFAAGAYVISERLLDLCRQCGYVQVRTEEKDGVTTIHYEIPSKGG